tara:strand:- start:1119 stop:1322 length:204 start_codon:yes stop_codon:yes gene_type:complete
MEDNNPFELPKHHMQNDNGNNGNNGNGGNGNHYGWEHSDDTPAAPIENPLLGVFNSVINNCFCVSKD